ncbi:LysR family transcriptional regulator [Pseudoxanthomonas winnipegensis]|uniref:LysR family transcriptional regulator n=1 Tax=Pseudoxanthomonas winnipegensis TaxID=2480810 RepID=UPI00197E9F33|nr:LysR family transcriptional regulator [Pseudoxanthomonas winnipegensis]
MRFDLPDLRLFLAVLDAGSITAGAERAHLSLAAASERLRAMEEYAGIVLLDRLPKGIRPTAAGEAVAHHARSILQQSALLRHALADHARGTRGRVRLMVNTATMSEALPAALAPWLAAHPHIDVDLLERSSEEIAKALEAGVVELGILSEAAASPGLQRQHFARDTLVALLPPAHAAASAQALGLADLAAEPWIGLPESSALQRHLDAQAAALGLRLAYRVRLRTFEAIGAMVAAGAGVAVVPAAALARLGPCVRGAALSEPWAQRRLCLCWDGTRPLSPTAQALRTHLADWADRAADR